MNQNLILNLDNHFDFNGNQSIIFIKTNLFQHKNGRPSPISIKRKFSLIKDEFKKIKASKSSINQIFPSKEPFANIKI